MFNLKTGRLICKIKSGNKQFDNKLLYLDSEEKNICCDKCNEKCVKKPCCGGCNLCVCEDNDNIEFGNVVRFSNNTKLQQLPRLDEREINYVCGPSGSGKSTYASKLMRAYNILFPHRRIFIFSRADIKKDPCFKGIHNIFQIPINETLVETPIDITRELEYGTMVLFDDCNTIQDDKQKKVIDKLITDIMEVGRKLGIWIIITNHLVIPNEKKVARSILNEIHTITFFPKSGSAQQITYCLNKYFGLNNKQISNILSIPSRWVTIYKNYPMFVLYENGAFLI